MHTATKQGSSAAVATRLRAFCDLWDALNRIEDHGIELQHDEMRAVAESLRIPYVAVELLYCCSWLTPEDLAEWARWPARGTFLQVLAGLEAEEADRDA
jgi:hypothetical protein